MYNEHKVDDPFFCKICNIILKNESAYKSHHRYVLYNGQLVHNLIFQQASPGAEDKNLLLSGMRGHFHMQG